ncbi:MAG TPA: PASTA domain-containing protein [Acidimicrobiales bacterium]|jgi:serine/threonine-protein kinase
MTEHVGRVVGGRYRLLAPLGSGASAEVYLADDVRLRRRVAVKLLHPALADDEGFLRRFRAEARAAAALSHPNIVAVFDWNGDEVPPYLVTEYLAGGSLRSILDAGQLLSPSQALLVGLQAAQALDHAHRQGFVHRDIKPANMMFGTEARLRLADFGLARAIAEAAWTEPNGAVLGTARYASPEQVRGEPLDGRSDIYALALVLIEAITGSVPFSTDTTIGTLMGRLDRAVPVPDEVGGLGPVLERAGQPLPGDRPTAAILVNDLMDAATELPRPAPLKLAGATAAHRSDPDPQDRTMLGAPTAPVAGTNGAGPTTTTVMAPTTVNRADHTAVHPQMVVSPPPPVVAPPSGGFALSPKAGRNHIPRGLVLGAVAAVALVVGVAGAWLFLQTQRPSHEVPTQLIGAQRSEISDMVGEFGWSIKVKEIYRDETTVGVVLETDPAPGHSLREGDQLLVTVSLGPTQVAVPSSDDLAGLTEDQADGVLRAAGVELVPEFVPTPNNDVDEGKVIGLEEGTPGHLPKGSTVRVLISSGRGRIRLQDMKGWDVENAQDELERLGLHVEIETAASEDVREGKVVRTDPGPNSQVDPGGTVTIFVSGGDNPIPVPDVTGMTVDEATTRLENAGLKVGHVRGRREGDVVGTDPFVGSEVDPGTEVDLWTL